MVAAAMGIRTEAIQVSIEADLDLRGTLGIAKDVPVGFEEIRRRFDVLRLRPARINCAPCEKRRSNTV
jgi:hypothetical protein